MDANWNYPLDAAEPIGGYTAEDPHSQDLSVVSN